MGLIKESLRSGRGTHEVMGNMADLLYVIEDHYYAECPRIGEFLEATFQAIVKRISSSLPLVCHSWTEKVTLRCLCIIFQDLRSLLG